MAESPEPDPTRSVSTWFAAEVRRHREKNGWSQAELANRLFCSEPKVGHLETGYRTRPTSTSVRRSTGSLASTATSRA